MKRRHHAHRPSQGRRHPHRVAAPLMALLLGCAGLAGAQTNPTEGPAPVEDRSSRTTEAQGQLEIATTLATSYLNAEAQKTTPPGVVTQEQIDAQVVALLKLHSEGQGWGALAQSLGFKLGPLISAAHRADQAEAASKLRDARREDRQANRQEDRREDRASDRSRASDDTAKSGRSDDGGARGRSSESSRGGSGGSASGGSSGGGGGSSGSGGGRGR